MAPINSSAYKRQGKTYDVFVCDVKYRLKKENISS